MEMLRKQLLDTIDENRERLIALSRRIFEHPETSMLSLYLSLPANLNVKVPGNISIVGLVNVNHVPVLI